MSRSREGERHREAELIVGSPGVSPRRMSSGSDESRHRPQDVRSADHAVSCSVRGRLQHPGMAFLNPRNGRTPVGVGHFHNGMPCEHRAEAVLMIDANYQPSTIERFCLEIADRNCRVWRNRRPYRGMPRRVSSMRLRTGSGQTECAWGETRDGMVHWQ